MTVKHYHNFILWFTQDYVLFNFQGAVVALIFCFLNGEVHSHLRNTIGRHIKLGSARSFTRKNSMSSATQITSFTSSRRGTKSYENSDRGYIPLSTSNTTNDVTTAAASPVSPTSPSNGHVTFAVWLFSLVKRLLHVRILWLTKESITELCFFLLIFAYHGIDLYIDLGVKFY